MLIKATHTIDIYFFSHFFFKCPLTFIQVKYTAELFHDNLIKFSTYPTEQYSEGQGINLTLNQNTEGSFSKAIKLCITFKKGKIIFLSNCHIITTQIILQLMQAHLYIKKKIW